MKYKGYKGHVEYNEKAKLFLGNVVGIKDVITFQSIKVNEIEQSFEDSVDDYLLGCKQRGAMPNKSSVKTTL